MPSLCVLVAARRGVAWCDRWIRHLLIPLFQAERSWSYAMDLKQVGSGVVLDVAAALFFDCPFWSPVRLCGAGVPVSN